MHELAGDVTSAGASGTLAGMEPGFLGDQIGSLEWLAAQGESLVHELAQRSSAASLRQALITALLLGHLRHLSEGGRYPGTPGL